MYCSQCGAQTPNDAVYCPACGNKLNRQNSEEPRIMFNYNKTNIDQKDEILSGRGLFYITGRRNRKPFICVFVVLAIMVNILTEIATTPFMDDIVYIILILILLMLAYMLAVNMGKRLQDLNFSGNIALGLLFIGVVAVKTDSHDLLAFVKFIISILNVILALIKGTNGPNKYGEDPLEN